MDEEISNRYIIWGSAGHAKVLNDLILQRGGRVTALFDNSPEAKSCLNDTPLYFGDSGFRYWVNNTEEHKRYLAAVAVGGHRGKERVQISCTIRESGIHIPALIHTSATVSATALVRNGSQILAGAVVAADASIGEMCIVNNSANIDHECLLGEGVHIAPGATLCGCVEVMDYAMVGAGAVVLPRLRVGVGALVGAGAVVTKHVPDGAVVVGNPARIIRITND